MLPSCVTCSEHIHHLPLTVLGMAVAFVLIELPGARRQSQESPQHLISLPPTGPNPQQTAAEAVNSTWKPETRTVTKLGEQQSSSAP